MGYNGVMSDSQHTDLLPAYLAVGEDALKREAVIARLKARLGTMGDMAFNSDEFDGDWPTTSSSSPWVTRCAVAGSR